MSSTPGKGTLESSVEKQVSSLKARIIPERMPRHIAIIMDGNGRWAERRGLPRIQGHRAAVKAMRKVVRVVDELKVPYLSLFAFSTENAERPLEEVSEIFRLFERTVDSEVPDLHARGVRIIFSGEIDLLPESLSKKFRSAESLTRDNRGLTLNVCVFYSGRSEITRAVSMIVKDAMEGKISANGISAELLSRYFYHPELSDPDLLIRTSGEMRVSNFLLWQIAYTELYFTDTLWPDFGEADFLKALLDFQNRDRRFGRV